MKHIVLDHRDERIKRFARALATEPIGSVLELKGKALFRIVPPASPATDRAKLKTAILRRRTASRQLNADWGAADRELWERIPQSQT